MNRVILIGNGFDLAHDLKTSYNDFIEWIINDIHKKVNESSGWFNNEDIHIKYNRKKISKQAFYIDIIKKSKEITYKNIFLKTLIEKKIFQNWSDIETIFYDELNSIINNNDSTENDLEKFNYDFQRIIELLEEYLENEKSNYKSISSVFIRIYNLINGTLLIKEDSGISFIKNKIFQNRNYDLKETLILDFNYTQTVKKYLDLIEKEGFSNKKIEYINIHGVLKDEKNPIIFGFGDEIDENYLKIEKSRLKGALNFIKSINYLKTSNYRKMLDFLELDYYQVYIWGHSCGLTDRTLLNHIFEHNNCTGIKPFYHQWKNKGSDSIKNDYIRIVSNIARNFTDKKKLRDRVVDYTRCEPLIKINCTPDEEKN